MKATLEKDVLKAIKQYLELAGCLVVRVNSGGIKAEHGGKKRFFRFNSETGCADLLCCVTTSKERGWHKQGEFLALEVKKPGGKATPEQKAFGERVALAGGTWACVSSIPEVRDVLRSMGADRVP